ncbi:hypothetical protein [Candidatus Palauibacter sp.]|uniref:hypothetical protein n=1 Tax=Candidatus Palauibacter sp. TaxID=3101350 RepID=UPI003CC53FCE
MANGVRHGSAARHAGLGYGIGDAGRNVASALMELAGLQDDRRRYEVQQEYLRARDEENREWRDRDFGLRQDQFGFQQEQFGAQTDRWTALDAAAAERDASLAEDRDDAATSSALRSYVPMISGAGTPEMRSALVDIASKDPHLAGFVDEWGGFSNVPFPEAAGSAGFTMRDVLNWIDRHYPSVSEYGDRIEGTLTPWERWQMAQRLISGDLDMDSPPTGQPGVPQIVGPAPEPPRSRLPSLLDIERDPSLASVAREMLGEHEPHALTGPFFDPPPAARASTYVAPGGPAASPPAPAAEAQGPFSPEDASELARSAREKGVFSREGLRMIGFTEEQITQILGAG